MRPVGGSMTYVADVLPNQRNIEEAIWTTLHEITHILAFDYDLYTDFIDNDFNMQKLKNVIKIKSRIKDFEKILKDGKEYLSDAAAFIKFLEGKGNTKLHPSDQYLSMQSRKSSFIEKESGIFWDTEEDKQSLFIQKKEQEQRLIDKELIRRV